jgi:thiosulfate dehydrogenase [quinone] large subunit
MITTFLKGLLLMPRSSSPNFSATSAEGTADTGPRPLQPLILSERSLVLLALVRIFVGLLWFQQLAWKMPPTFGGLRRYVESEAQHTLVPGYSTILTNVFLTHFSVLGALVWTAELLVAVTLLFGLCTRLGSMLALLLSVQLYAGLAYAPGEWYWTYGMLVLLALGLLAVPAGRCLGLDQLLAPRIQQAARSHRLLRLLSWLV